MSSNSSLQGVGYSFLPEGLSPAVGHVAASASAKKPMQIKVETVAIKTYADGFANSSSPSGSNSGPSSTTSSPIILGKSAPVKINSNGERFARHTSRLAAFDQPVLSSSFPSSAPNAWDNRHSRSNSLDRKNSHEVSGLAKKTQGIHYSHSLDQLRRPSPPQFILDFVNISRTQEDLSSAEFKIGFTDYLKKHFGDKSLFSFDITDSKFISIITNGYYSILNYKQKVERIAGEIFNLFRDKPEMINELEGFVNDSPKGELHCHLSGAMSPKDLIAFAIKHGFLFDQKEQVFCRPNNETEGDPERYIQVHKLKDVEKILSMAGCEHKNPNDKQNYFFNHLCRIAESITNLLSLDEMLLVYLKDALMQNLRLAELMIDLRIDENFPEEYQKCFSFPGQLTMERMTVSDDMTPASAASISPDDSPTLGSQSTVPLIDDAEIIIQGIADLPKPGQSISTGSNDLIDCADSKGSKCYSTTDSGSSGNSSDSESSSVKRNSISEYDDRVLENKWKNALRILVESGWIGQYLTSWTKKVKECNQSLNESLDEIAKEHGMVKPTQFYLVEIMRDVAPDKELTVFATIAAAMALELHGRENPDEFVGIVGINLVGPEHEISSRLNFPLQMKMLEYLKKVYKNPRISLHAGEFSGNGRVGAWDSANHLTSSVKIADRVGHATAAARAPKAREILQKGDKAVEISPTSNEMTMGRPISNYLINNGIPVILCADDPGMFQTTLTNEYLKFIKAVKCDYKRYKDILRAAFHFSFAPGQSIYIWSREDRQLHLHPLFWDIYEENYVPNELAEVILKSSKKARLQLEMERSMVNLENRTIVDYSKVLEENEQEPSVHAIPSYWQKV